MAYRWKVHELPAKLAEIIESNGWELIYARLQYPPKQHPRWILLCRKYQGGNRWYPEQIREKDYLVFICIYQAHECDLHPEGLCWQLNSFAFSFDDQESMWEAIFDVKVKESETRGTHQQQTSAIKAR